jgi:hypothetical protein
MLSKVRTIPFWSFASKAGILEPTEIPGFISAAGRAVAQMKALKNWQAVMDRILKIDTFMFTPRNL